MDGTFLIGGAAIARPETFTAVDPSTGEEMTPEFSVASLEDVAAACQLAEGAFDAFRELAPSRRAEFLEAIADQIEALGDELVSRAMAESGLPQVRLTGERGRTTNQLRMFAGLLREGRWVGVVIDHPLPERQPPRPDLRQRRIGIGPVAVFGASNFPLAFSVAGGDTASAFAAGCPVVVKAHPAHPGTSALVGEAIRKAVRQCGLPEGVFSLLQGPSNDLGAALVADRRIKGVGFTGSRAGGLALLDIANRRSEPIPVYAEMSSVNPVVLFPEALSVRAEALGAGYVGSLALGAGQFCTNPGVVFALAGPDLDRFLAAARETLALQAPQTMLTPAIHSSYGAGVAALAEHAAVEKLGEGVSATGCNQCQAAIFITTAACFTNHPELNREIFGAASLVVKCETIEEMHAAIASMEGQLTATIQIEPGDVEAARTMLPMLERKVGRILANGWPTGVEVCRAIVHGGPFPATSDARTTSVGTAAIERFLRPVCYQDLPEGLLPEAVKETNPLGLPRTEG